MSADQRTLLFLALIRTAQSLNESEAPERRKLARLAAHTRQRVVGAPVEGAEYWEAVRRWSKYRKTK